MSTVNSSTVSESGVTYNAVFTDETDNSTLSATDFLSLIVTELSNQDFTNTTDTTDMVNQLAQFSMVSSMQELSAYSKSNYAMSLLGKTLTATRYATDGTETVTDTCDKVSLVDDEYVVYIGGKSFSLSQIMQIEPASSSSSDTNTTTESEVTPTNFSIEAEDVTDSAASISWEVPTEDDAVAADLTYTVYYTPYDSEDTFDTVAEVTAGTMGGEEDQTSTTAELEDLDAGTSYYVNVVVTDGNGVQSVYEPVIFKTKIA